MRTDFLDGLMGFTNVSILDCSSFSFSPSGCRFFDRLSSKNHYEDPLLRLSSLITGPTIAATASAAALIAALYFACTSCVRLIAYGAKEAQDNAEQALCYLLCSAIAFFAAALNPLINAIDLIGGGLHSLVTEDKAESIKNVF